MFVYITIKINIHTKANNEIVYNRKIAITTHDTVDDAKKLV